MNQLVFSVWIEVVVERADQPDGGGVVAGLADAGGDDLGAEGKSCSSTKPLQADVGGRHDRRADQCGIGHVERESVGPLGKFRRRRQVAQSRRLTLRWSA